MILSVFITVISGHDKPQPSGCLLEPESEGATVDESLVVGLPVSDFEFLFCHAIICVVGRA